MVHRGPGRSPGVPSRRSKASRAEVWHHGLPLPRAPRLAPVTNVRTRAYKLANPTRGRHRRHVRHVRHGRQGRREQAAAGLASAPVAAFRRRRRRAPGGSLWHQDGQGWTWAPTGSSRAQAVASSLETARAAAWTPTLMPLLIRVVARCGVQQTSYPAPVDLLPVPD